NPENLIGLVRYRTHVQKVGWQQYVQNDILSGTVGKGLRLEAIEIKLTGDLAEKYDVYYRVQAQKFGWLGWAKNGESAGTSGYGYRLEAIQIQLAYKDTFAPGSTKNAYRKK
ncbi:hydrophobic W protein, partial [Lachnospiraceae bacterium RM5]